MSKACLLFGDVLLQFYLSFIYMMGHSEDYKTQETRPSI